MTEKQIEIVAVALDVIWDQVHEIGPMAIGLDDYSEEEIKEALKIATKIIQAEL